MALHPLAEMIIEAGAGRFPPVDGGWRRVPPWRPGIEAVVAFTGHAVLALGDDVTGEWLGGFPIDGFGGAHDPRLVCALAGPDGWIDSLDLMMINRGTGEPDQPAALVGRADLTTHPRAEYAAEIRDQSMVLGYPDPDRSAVAIVARGVAGLAELSFELEPGRRGAGAGSALIRAAVAAIPAGEPVIASVAPGNAASVRALLGAGFAPLASLQLFRRG